MRMTTKFCPTCQHGYLVPRDRVTCVRCGADLLFGQPTCGAMVPTGTGSTNCARPIGHDGIHDGPRRTDAKELASLCDVRDCGATRMFGLRVCRRHARGMAAATDGAR